MKSVWLMLVCTLKISWCFEQDFKGFDDNILFGINWPGVENTLEIIADDKSDKPQPASEVLKVTTANQESYACHLPELKTKENTSVDEYDGPSPLQLLKPLFSQKICSYRLESYWSYEVCHGRYIRQYHEEREGKQVKTQEFYLGHWSSEKLLKLESDEAAAKEKKITPKMTKVDGTSLPYIEMVMDDGTICDLSGKPRQTSVKYVCYSHGKHEVYSFKETSTCQYEIIILSPLLCEHPLFKPKDVSENTIYCRPLDGAPKKPKNLLEMEAYSNKLNHQSIKLMNNQFDKDAKDVLAVLKVEKVVDQDGETHLKLELHPLQDNEALLGGKKVPMIDTKTPVIADDTPVRAFLLGENCLNGGTGWWKYEFCYGKHVEQYHIDRSGEKTTLRLGKFNREDHLKWIKEFKGKAPKPVDQRTSISHFYSNGDICDKTGKPRQTEVKLKCLENSSSPAQVSLYLLEPRTCHYILGVESPLICEILPLADENGLINLTSPVFEKLTTVTIKKEEEETNTEKNVEKVVND